MKKVARVICIRAELLVAPGPASSHSNGRAQISGIITDPSGALILNAQVKAIETQTGLDRDTFSNANGNYVLPNLPAGPYRLEVGGSGFDRYINTFGSILSAQDPGALQFAARYNF